MLDRLGDIGVEHTDRTRRRVLAGGAAVAAGLVLPALAKRLVTAKAAKAPIVAKVGTLNTPSECELWESIVGQSVRLTGGNGGFGATLAAVERLPFDALRPAWLGRSRSFFVYLTAGLGFAPSDQRSYTLSHPTIGEMQIFLARGEDRGNEALLTALFN
jgi:hypothetical protein